MPYPTGDRVTDAIISALIKRQAEGQDKYDTTLAESELHDQPFMWLNELQEELLDAIQYIEKFKLEQELLYERVVETLVEYDITVTNDAVFDSLFDELERLFYPDQFAVDE